MGGVCLYAYLNTVAVNRHLITVYSSIVVALQCNQKPFVACKCKCQPVDVQSLLTL